MSTSAFGDLLAKAKEAKFVVVPKDDYGIVCTNASATQSSTGKPMLKLTTKIVVGPHAGVAPKPSNQTLTIDNPIAVKIFFDFLAAFGLDDEFLESLPPGADGGPNWPAVAQALKGRACVAAIDSEEYQGETSSAVQKFKKPSPEMKAAIEQGLETMGVSGAFGAPSAGPADPFAASAPAAPGGDAAGTEGF
jgi:hypothetical protein